MRWTFKSMTEKSSIPSPKQVGLIQSGEGLKRTKRLSFLWGTAGFSCLTALALGHQLFSAFRLELKYWLFLGLKPVSLCTGPAPSVLLLTWPSDWNWDDTISSLGSPACWPTLQVLELVSLHNYMIQFCITHLFLYI